MKISGGRNLEISSPGLKASGPPASRIGREERKAGGDLNVGRRELRGSRYSS